MYLWRPPGVIIVEYRSSRATWRTPLRGTSRLTNQGLLKDHTRVLVVPDRSATSHATTRSGCRNRNIPHITEHVGIFEIWFHDRSLREIAPRTPPRYISRILRYNVRSYFPPVSTLVIAADARASIFHPSSKKFRIARRALPPPPPSFFRVATGHAGELRKTILTDETFAPILTR